MKELDMLRGSLGMLILAVLVGFAGIAAGARGIARSLLFLFLMIRALVRVCDMSRGRWLSESTP